MCREVYYEWIQPYGPIEIGVLGNVRRLDSAINNIGTDPKIVYAFSGGARNASVWLRDQADDADAPDPEGLSFVLIGNGGRKYGGVNGWFWGDLLRTPTDTQYDIVDIAREYDPIADFPTNPFNLLALANALAAFQYVHLNYDEVDVDDPDNIVWKEGRTTYVHVPTEHLPLLQGFYNFGLGSLVEDLEPALTASIDKAYNRTWLEGKQPQGASSTLSARSTLASFSVADDGAGSEDIEDSASDIDTDAGQAEVAEDSSGGESQPASGDVPTDSADTDEVSTAGKTDPAPEAGESRDSEATGDTDDAPSADAAGDGEAADGDADADGQAGDDGDTDTAANAGDTEPGDAATGGGKHRAPLNGAKKAAQAGGSESGSGDADAGDSTSDSESGS